MESEKTVVLNTVQYQISLEKYFVALLSYSIKISAHYTESLLAKEWKKQSCLNLGIQNIAPSYVRII
jgi:hypothetical protein